MVRLTLSIHAALAAAIVSSASAAQLLESGSFESPRIHGRTPRIQGGSPLRATRSDWMRFDEKVGNEQGQLKAGITDEIARSGKQALFIEFNKLTTDKAAVTLGSKLISIQPNQKYRVAIYGRLPRENPLTIQGRLAYMKLFIEFFKTDGESPCEEGPQNAMRAQPIPGSRNRPPLFTAGRWSEYFTEVRSPADAAFMKIMWQWDTPAQEGAATGVIFFDDAVIIGEPGPKAPEPELRDPAKMDDEGNYRTDAAKPPAATPASTPAPAATPAKARKQ